MQVRVLKPGLQSTVQDMGRWAHLADAVPVSGVVDTLSAAIANIACGNDPYGAVIELTYADAVFRAETDLLIAYAGDGAKIYCADMELDQGKPVFIPAGSKISFHPADNGCRTYLAVAGGWNVPEILGSRSTCLVAGFGGFKGRELRKDDLLDNSGNISGLSKTIYNSLKGDRIKCANWNIAKDMFLPVNRNTIRVVPGPEFAWFRAHSILNFLSEPYRLTVDCNRMGYRLSGDRLEKSIQQELISTAVTPGTIQVSNDGNPILLMADCQTTGGYPRIGQVAAVDLPLCAQLKPGDEIFFTEISCHEAETLYLELQEELAQLQEVIRAKYFDANKEF